MKRVMILLLLFSVAVLAAAPASHALRCGNNLVSEGDTAAEVVIKCGEPYYRERHTEKHIQGADTDREIRTSVVVEEWTYNFGPQDWLYLLIFRNGTLVEIKTRGYGYPRGSAVDPCDKGRHIALGDTTAEVILKCGTPEWKQVRRDEVREKTDEDRERRISVEIEEWTYNFGPLGWVYHLRFENGKLVDIKTRGYGQ